MRTYKRHQCVLAFTRAISHHLPSSALRHAMHDSRPSPAADGNPAITSCSDESTQDGQHQATPSHPPLGAGVQLPRNTKCIISGNARTKPELVGLEVYTKKAVGLGGWHWLVLPNGEEIKLQRNALTILEWGQEDGQDSSDDQMTATDDTQIEIMTRPRSRRPARQHSPSPDIYKKPTFALRSTTTGPHVNLYGLGMASLRRYHRAYDLGDVDASAPKEELLFNVKQHFKAQTVDEDNVLMAFMQAVRRRQREVAA